jgi:pSer/pThr/pTyr-binding forkhead associated (FHA) protein
MSETVSSLEAAWDTVHVATRGTPLQPDETLHQATVQIDSIQSFLKGPRFVVAATGSLVVIPQKDRVLIGRADPRGNVVPDIDLATYGGGSAGVSRQHARLVRQGDGWVIEDLSSTNGTFVNDQPVPPSRSTRLSDGDQVRCGQLLLIFHAQ